ncbi:helix-turn-helix domain-containing protein [Clostridium butyricum]|uniref:helix-turn-helix domain-containing protein n=1 Tax=Clostridium butyricum TaxID=1492 RepID=UPI0013D0BF7C|nr:helix-turn-helix transcriptional regulator [Clostridium butyricum]MCQ2017445.1 helix-turn-helix transcriptional regulator [Clostridium butyricum]MCQ2022899.1 helix-turn-helix transcriptional regulator [Clostridium butyricum]MCQ2026614.1 helix-turn-helix transcriptional regulator [Clostridium butyricum]NFB71978.1 XRE family transcriptional regulator [Clostridium butyricum]NFB91890.1 XRE family transcriptional regulator [Clostridium butyricum]
MNERFKEIRLKLNLTQEEFGERIGIKSRAHISALESGRRTLIDRIITDVCREFNVNEDWLRFGNGETFIEPDSFSLDDYIKSKGATQLELDLIKSYFEIPEDLRNSLMNHFKNNILKQMKNTEEAATIEDTSSSINIDYEVESYRQELEAEQKEKTSSASEKPKGA